MILSENAGWSALGLREIVISSVTPSQSSGTAGRSYSPEEIGAMLGNLTALEWKQIAGASRHFARDHYFLAADLRQEAFVRLLDGRRTCSRDFNIVNCIVGIMRSLTSQERDAVFAGNRPVLVGSIADLGLTAASQLPSPEQLGYDALHYRRTLTAIYEAVAGDRNLKLLVEASMDGIRGIELQRRLDLDATGLASLRRQLKRVLDRATKDRSVP